MLQSWLVFTGSFSFHFAKLPRQNFRRKFCHLSFFFNEREFFTFSTLKTIDARKVYIELVEMLAPEKLQNGSSGTKCV